MNQKVKGIVLKLNDYKDADKLATIFTLEDGVITAKFTGVRREKAKLKSIAQPFAYADFELMRTSGYTTVISAYLNESFTGILTNYSKMMCGYVVLDILSSILPKEKTEQEIFLLTLTALKNIENENEHIALIDYILKFIYFTGEGLSLPDKVNKVFLDRMTTDFTHTRDITTTEIDLKVYAIIYDIANKTDYTELQLITASEYNLKQALRLLNRILSEKFDTELKSFNFI